MTEYKHALEKTEQDMTFYKECNIKVRKKMKNGKTVLVTGGCGFIGANFVRLLHEQKKAWRVVNLDKLTYAGNLSNLEGLEENGNYRFVKGDICDAALLEKLFDEEGIDTVVHFAAESHVDRSIYGPAAFIQTNIVGTFTLLETARKVWLSDDTKVSDPLFLHVSTDEVVRLFGGRRPFLRKRQPMTRDRRIRPQRPRRTILFPPIIIPTACRF